MSDWWKYLTSIVSTSYAEKSEEIEMDLEYADRELWASLEEFEQTITNYRNAKNRDSYESGDGI